MTQHTQGKLTLELVESDTGTIKHLCPVDEAGMSVLTVVEHNDTKFAAVYLDEDARRIAACWNACEGIPTEMLEAVCKVPLAAVMLVQQRDELLEALKELSSAEWPDDGGPILERARVKAREAIAKVEGGAA